MQIINLNIIYKFSAHISFSLDNNWIGTIPTGDGFFRRGQFTGFNPWAQAALNAPFDQEVNPFTLNINLFAQQFYIFSSSSF